jgi:hypothetical protein
LQPSFNEIFELMLNFVGIVIDDQGSARFVRLIQNFKLTTSFEVAEVKLNRADYLVVAPVGEIIDPQLEFSIIGGELALREFKLAPLGIGGSHNFAFVD